MTALRASPNRLIVVMDPEFGDRLRDVWPGGPVWIVLSPSNEPVVRSFWATHPEPCHLIGITGMHFNSSVAVEDQFLAELETIDLHHGPCSADTPYTQIAVIGCRLNAPTREALQRLGFIEFDDNNDGFIATRNSEEAATRQYISPPEPPASE